MLKEYSFEEQLKLGKLGEQKVIKYLNNLPETIKIWDVSDEAEFRGYGIDGILVEDRENMLRCTPFDVKTDYYYHRTGKLFIEITANSDKMLDGGILSTKAEVFYYYDPYNGHLFTLPIYSMRNWYNRTGISINHKGVKNEAGYETTGVAVGPDDLVLGGVVITECNIGGLSPNVINTLNHD